MAKKRLSIPGLVPGEEYAIQVRAVDGGDDSQWSEKHDVNTISDFVGENGEPRYPSPPTLLSWDTSTGSFVAEWTSVTTMTDGSVPAISNYEMYMVADINGTLVDRLVPHYGTTGATQRREFSLGAMRGAFGATPGVVSLKVRAVNKSDNIGQFSNELSASIGVPDPPTDAVPPPTAEGMMEAVKLRWTPPVNMAHVAGYRVYWSTDPNFTPGPGFKSYEGPANEFTLTSGTYSPHYFKIRSYSAWGTESTDLLATATPKSPYGPDDIAPLVPTLNAPTLNPDRTVSGQANLSWSVQGDGLAEFPEENKDISGFVIAWRLANDTNWRNSYFEKDARAGVIDLPRAFANYEFKIAAYDFVANYSDFSAVQTLDGAGPAPLTLTGVDAVTRWDGMKLLWNHSESQAVINGGRYEIQHRSTNSFADSVPNYTTGNRELDLSGLQPAQSTWYWRVRAVDVMGRPGPWSGVEIDTLPAFPSAATTDKIKPQTAPQNVKATGGLNYINASWDVVQNTDDTWYEVYMSATSGFTVGPANFAGRTSATSIMLNTLPGGPNNGILAQGTTYYIKVRAMDADGDGPVSAQASSQLTQIAGGDLGINMSGENLLFETSFETDSNGDGLANFWSAYNQSPGTTPHSTSRGTGRTGGYSQIISWTGANAAGGVKGIHPLNQGQLTRPNTEYTLSFYARAGAGAVGTTVQAGTGFDLKYNTNPASGPTAINNPAPSPTVWNRYAFKFTTDATADTVGFFATIVGHTANGGWVEFDDIQLEAGNIPSAYKVGTTSISKLTTGTLETAVMTIAAGGQIRSSDYDFAAKKGFLITGTAINLLGGTVNAATLAADTTIANNLFIGAKLQVSTDGYIQSANYDSNGTGYRITKDVIDIRNGTVAAGTLGAGIITSPDIRVGAGGKITVDSTGGIESNNWNLANKTGWRIDSTGITMDANSKVDVNALETGTLTSTTVTIGSGGVIQSAGWATNPQQAVRWNLSETGLTMIGGSIRGAEVITNQLKSEGSETIDGVVRYKFSINDQGYAEFSGARVYGNMTVGSGANNFVQSAGYGGAYGWKLHGDGVANFMRMNTWNMSVYESATVGNHPSHLLQSGNFAGWGGGAGWGIRGDGHAEFWGGSFSVGGWAGGQIRLQNWGSGESIVQFLLPGNWNGYHYIKASGQNFDIRGAYGGAVVFTADTTVRSSLHHAVDYDIWAGRNIGAGNKLEAPILGGDPVHNWLSTGAQTGAGIGSGARLIRLGSSSIRFKDDVKPLEIDYKSILSLEPKTFYWKPEKAKELGADGIQTGFIAEDAVGAGLDHWVYYLDDPDTGEKVLSGFQYGDFVVAQQVVLREHDKQIEDLKDQIKALEKLLNSRS